ncbi:MAG: hypothetical protein HUN04_19500 [Desulfobacter sp.]|nr:MAG: hypothetical protein HUN04_19500 [Desulfobacter sp.]
MMKNTIILKILACLVAACAFTTAPSLSGTSRPVQKKLVMSHLAPETEPVGCWLKMIYTDVFSHLGYELEYLHLPAARASILAEKGKIDGELGRTRSYGKNYPDLVMVTEPHLTEEFVVYTLEKGLCIKDWDDLAARPGIISFKRGLRIIEDQVAQRRPGDTIIRVNNFDAGLILLEIKRARFFVGPRKRMEGLLKNRSSQKPGIYPAGTLDIHTAHAYLHSRHRELAADAAVYLKSMKKSGLLDTYKEKCGF